MTAQSVSFSHNQSMQTLRGKFHTYQHKALREANERETKFTHFLQRGWMVLEGGCGKRSMVKKYGFQDALLFGIDINADSLRANSEIPYIACANMQSVPFQAKSFDAVSLNGVIEHLEHPKEVLKECYRVLRPGGYLFFSTHNFYSPFMGINVFLPLKLRHLIKLKILSMKDISLETFPAYYRCNTLGRISKIMKSVGFQEEYLDKFGFPMATSPLLLHLLFYSYEKITDYGWLRRFKNHFVGGYQRPREYPESKANAEQVPRTR